MWSTITKNETAAAVEESGDDDESTNEVVVIVQLVHLDHPHHQIGSTLLTNFYRTSSNFKKLNSNIIIKDNIAISNEIIYHTNSKLLPQLLYRGSRDGFKSIDFHSKCDNQGPTLTIIKSEHNQIFGGFTTQSWKTPPSTLYGEYISDDSAFIFKIIEHSNQLLSTTFRKFNIKQHKTHRAICIYPNYLTTFGDGDFSIKSDCNLNNDSFSQYFDDYTYELLPTNGSVKTRNYLAGSHKFKVSEIEVFKISTTNTNTTS